MSVVTISRGLFSGGKLLAECLARNLGYRCVDRETIAERGAARDVSQKELLDALLKPPGFLERFQHKRYQYLALLQSGIAEEVKSDKVIYHGNAGHLLLRGPWPVVKIRVIAPLEKRIATLEDRLKLDRTEAMAYIHKVDGDRKKWTRFLYGVNWEDPYLYDLVVNLDTLDIDDACELVTAAVRQQRHFGLTEKCQADLKDLALASRVRADLSIDAATSHLEFEVTAHRGVVGLRGKLTSIEEESEVKRVAQSVPGVAQLDLSGVSPPALN
jgi:cytidylate kinase